MRLWRCPNCGEQVRAPERMRKNDVRRFCLSCSQGTGFLVERSVPALERRRQEAAALRRSKDAKRREREREARLTKLQNARGEEVSVDLVAEVRRALREMGSPGAARYVTVEIRRRSDGLSSGRAFPWENRVVLSVGDSLEDALVLAYHEAAHIAAGTDERDPRGRRWHGERFQRRLADAFGARWPFIRYGSLRGQSGYEPGWRVRGQLKEHVRNGGEL